MGKVKTKSGVYRISICAHAHPTIHPILKARAHTHNTFYVPGDRAKETLSQEGLNILCM